MQDSSVHASSNKVQRLYLQVAHQLQQIMESGEFQPGQRLPSERHLAVELGVSRPTIREAIIALEIAGMVEVRTGSGVYLLDRSSQQSPLTEAADPGPFEILEARLAVESEACSLAAERITKNQLDELRLILGAMQEENQLPQSTENADEKFHCLIARASGNSALETTVWWLWKMRNESALSNHFHKRVRNEGSKPILADHQAILKALAAGDAEAARQAMRRHLQSVITDLLDAN